MIIDQLPSVGTPALTDETVTEQGQNLFKVTWQRLLALFKANTATSELANDAGFVNATQAAAAAPLQSVNGATGVVVIDTDSIGAMPTWELLWTNASPSSSFSAQTVSLDLSGYDFVFINFNFPDMTAHRLVWGKIGERTTVHYEVNSRHYRNFTASATGVQFEAGMYASNNSNSAENNNNTSIPVNIWAIKGVST